MTTMLRTPATVPMMYRTPTIGVFKVLQGFLPGHRGIEENGVTKRTAQALEDRRTEQEGLDVLRLLTQDLFHKIVQHEMVAAGK